MPPISIIGFATVAFFFIFKWKLSHQIVKLREELKTTQNSLQISKQKQNDAQHKIAQLKKQHEQYDLTQEEHRKLFHAVEQSPCSIVITNLKGNIEYVNPKFTQVTGYDSAEVIGQNPRILKSGDKTSEDYSNLWHTISSGREWEGEFHNRKKNGELYWEFASISPIKNDTGHITHFIAIKEDITHRKALEESLRDAECQRVLAETAGAAAHEIYQPLTIQVGLTQLLNRKLTKDDPLKPDIETLLESALKIKDIVQKMSTIRSYKTRPYTNGESIIDFQDSSQPIP